MLFSDKLGIKLLFFKKSSNTKRKEGYMKNAVLSAFADLFSQKIQSLTQILEDTRKRAQAAPGSNVSHSDTSRFSISNIALGIEAQLNLAREALIYLNDLNDPHYEKEEISVGSLFVIIDKDSGKELTFMLLIKGGGEKISIGETEVVSITFGAPITKVFFGKKVGDYVLFNNRTYRVVRVC
jgi:hypothetical protein